MYFRRLVFLLIIIIFIVNVLGNPEYCRQDVFKEVDEKSQDDCVVSVEESTSNIEQPQIHAEMFDTSKRPTRFQAPDKSDEFVEDYVGYYQLDHEVQRTKIPTHSKDSTGTITEITYTSTLKDSLSDDHLLGKMNKLLMNMSSTSVELNNLNVKEKTKLSRNMQVLQDFLEVRERRIKDLLLNVKAVQKSLNYGGTNKLSELTSKGTTKLSTLNKKEMLKNTSENPIHSISEMLMQLAKVERESTIEKNNEENKTGNESFLTKLKRVFKTKNFAEIPE